MADRVSLLDTTPLLFVFCARTWFNYIFVDNFPYPIGSCFIVLKKCRKNDKILFINASSDEHYEKGKRQNYLRDEDVDKIVSTYQYRKEETRYSRQVSLPEIKENEYNLNITRYVNLSKEEERIDLLAINRELKTINEQIESARNRHNKFLRELGLPEIPPEIINK